MNKLGDLAFYKVRWSTLSLFIEHEKGKTNADASDDQILDSICQLKEKQRRI